ncbi:MAG: homoserine dehydrogenase, partial [Armatimonadetes bacterium]|nr:homoserine dehydrogenase [Armatimonadota bacterium]
MPDCKSVRVGILGFGTVGEGTYRMLADNRDEIVKKTGCPIDVVKIGVRHAKKARSLPPEMFTTDLDSIVCGPDVDVVLELIGGESPAKELIERALESGKHVVTANKEL